MRTNRPRLRVAAAALTMLLLVACGSAGNVETTGGPQPPPTTPTVQAQGHSDTHLAAANRRAGLEHLFVSTANRNAWYAEIDRQRIAAEEARVRAAEEAARQAEAKKAQEAAQEAAEPEPSYDAPSYGSGRCGGDLPPCYVMQRESGGNIRAENPTSTASGKWQFLDSTWAGYGGYSHASHAPESVQDAKARQLWAGGAGCSHWSAC